MGRKKAAVRDDDESGHAGGKSKKKAFSIGDDEYSAATEISKKLGLKDEEEDAPAIEFAGKKNGKKSACGVNSAFELLREEEEELAAFESLGEDEESRDKEEENVGINFTGKKKKKSKGLNKASGNLGVLDEENDEGNNIGETTFEAVNGDFDIIEPNQRVDETKTKKQTNEGVLEKKKSGKSPQEGDDFDKILGAVPTSVETLVVPPPEKKADVDEEKEDEGPVESAALKKKKKKKEKEKAKKAAAAEDKQKEANTEVINKPAEKIVPSHVRAKQEELARRKEAEEKIKREEDERLRKEEEERLRIEEEERIAEEKKRLKKEKEKEKLLKKKQEGKLLTKKQKKEACRSEAMRRQILSKASMQTDTGEISGAAAKRPLYQKKNSKPQAPSDGTVDNTTLDSGQGRESKETSQEDAASSSTKDKTDASVFQENTVDDDEWDAKSWDDADLKLPGKGAFDDEEVDLWPEPLLKKETHSVAAKGDDLAEKVARSKNVDFKKKNSEADASDKNNNKIPIHRGKTKNKEQKSDDHPVQNGQNLRSPICCIMGHVDTGKTKLLDCIRGTNVQEGEAGGITQQIGATYFPTENIRERTRELKADARLNVPGLLVIDTPGHESFTNLRSRGSGLCDIAVLVVDIMHGLEQQTIESLNLLKMRNTYFIVALNKVDTLFGWKKCPNAPIRKAMAQQTRDVQDLFNDGIKKVKNQLQEQGLNTELYYKNKEMGDTFHIVPTSAKSGEGIPDLLLLLVIWAQKTMIERLTYTDVVQCTVLEVKVVEGHGTTVDVVLVNGVLHEGDQIVVCGMQGPIVTTIRTLLTPHPMKELRVKGTYLHHKEIKAAMGIKITAQGLDHTIAGTSLYVVGPHDDLEDIKVLAMEDMKSVMSKIDISSEGVYVQASTLGSLEALLEFLKSPAVHIPVSGISIAPVHKKDVMKASVMLEKKKEYGTILAFDVKVTEEARELADNLGVKIFTADVIYHLFDLFKAYIDNLKEEKKKKAAKEAVFPCVLKIKPDGVIHAKDPLVLGVDVLEGIVKVGTPICVPQREFIDIGLIDSIQFNKKNLDYAKKGQMVAIKIINQSPGEQHKIFGRHFDVDDQLVSKISRSSIDALAENYAEDLSPEMVRLLKKLKVIFHIR